MSRSNRSQSVWSWRRWIDSRQQDAWAERLQELSCAVTEKPGRVRTLLTVYPESRQAAELLRKKWGGRVGLVKASDWLPKGPMAVLKIGSKLEVSHEKSRRGKRSGAAQLCIPYGLAFGSGEHATTSMLLGALFRRGMQPRERLLDLGTGSGILALGGRLLGAKRIVATDFDAAAIRTARANEKLNFRDERVRWQCADVLRLSARSRYDLVLANLFSGILCEAAARIAAVVAPGGELWLSGILRHQQAEVERAYRQEGMRLLRATARGKWVMLRWAPRSGA